MRNDPDRLECCWCPASRFRNRTELNEHEAAHAEADRRMREREARPASGVLADRLSDAAAGGLVNGPTTEVVQ